MARSMALVAAAILVAAALAGCTASVPGSAGPASSNRSAATGDSARTTVSTPIGTTPGGSARGPTSSGTSSVPETGPSGATGSGTTRPRVEIVLKAVTSQGAANPSLSDLQTSADVLRKRVAPIDGATVTVLPPDRIKLEAPGEELTVFDDLIRPGVLTVRPVAGTWPVGTADKRSGQGLPTAATAPPASAFPAGSDPKVRTQPSADGPSGWKHWLATAKRYTKAGHPPSCAQIDFYRGLDDPDKPLLACDTDATWGYVLSPTIIPGTAISTAEAAQGINGVPGWVVNVTLSIDAQRSWADYTSAHVGKQVALALDGQVLTAPQINGPIPGGAVMISGSFTRAQATDIARWLDSGALPLTFRVTSRQVIG